MGQGELFQLGVLFSILGFVVDGKKSLIFLFIGGSILSNVASSMFF